MDEKQVIVPSKWWRNNVRAIYERALADADVPVRNITVHIDSIATVQINAADLEKVEGIAGLTVLSDISRIGNVKVVHDDAIDFLRQHNPTYSPETEKAQPKMTPERQAEIEHRRHIREMVRKLVNTHLNDEE